MFDFQGVDFQTQPQTEAMQPSNECANVFAKKNRSSQQGHFYEIIQGSIRRKMTSNGSMDDLLDWIGT